MNHREVQQMVDDLEPKVERLKALYQQYFMGIEKIPPAILKRDVERMIAQLRRQRLQNTATRYKFQMIVQRLSTYQQYWNRILRQIENGTYKRDIQRAAARFGKDDALAAGGRDAATALRDMDDDESVPVVWELSDEPSADLGAGGAPGVWTLPDTAHVGGLPDPTGGEAAAYDPYAHSGYDQGGHAHHPTAYGYDPYAQSQHHQHAQTEQERLYYEQQRAYQEELRAYEERKRVYEEYQQREAARLAAEQREAARLAAEQRAAEHRAAEQRAAEQRAAEQQTVERHAAQQHAARQAALAQPSQLAPQPPVARAVPAPAPSQPQRPVPGPSVNRPLPPPPRRPLPPPPKAASEPAAAPVPAPAPSAPAAPSPPASPPQPAPEPPGARPQPRRGRALPGGALPGARRASAPDKETREIYNKYVQARRQAGESTANITYDKLAKSLQAQRQTLKKKHGDRNVDFEVVTKDGRTMIRPVIK